MAIRRTETTVTFRNPFTLPSIEGCHPAGTYRVVTEDDAVTIGPFAVTTRIATHLHTPALSLMPAAGNVFTIPATELQAAIEEDRQLETKALSHEPETRP